MRLLIIIPAYNEEENIEIVVDDLIQNYPQYDYIIINDGSKDNTAKICKENHYNLIDLPINLGLAGAFQTGVKYGYEQGYDAVLQYDGDGQHQAQYIEKMLHAMEEQQSDIVIGSRFWEKKKPGGLRMLGARILKYTIKFTSGKAIADPTSGMRLINKTVLKEFATQMNYGPEPDTIAYLIRNGARVTEVQVEMKERIAGESYLNLKNSILYMSRMLVSIVLFQGFRKRGK
ncbi:MAG: glycosyltransferase family 2 protein [Lachnospiraceae bacterium]|nr:glycosyltransferase family 2 protein [Lachnospiraceae bacterium]